MHVGIPLKCFQHAGANMKRITVPLHLQGSSGDTISVSRIALGTDVDHTLGCPTTP